MATSVMANDSPLHRTVSGLEQCLLDGGLRTGDRLPSEQKLADRFQVSRGTVRSALRRLEVRGLIRSRRNRGYVALPSAVSGQSILAQTIGLATDIPGRIRGPFVSGDLTALNAGVADRIAESGRNCLVLHPDFLIGNALERVAEHPPAGLVVSCMNPRFPDDAALARLAEMAIPLVIHNDFRGVVGQDSVQSDHAQGSYDLTRWLITQGRRRILRLWSTSRTMQWLQWRDAGYERALREAGLPVLPAVMVTNLPQRQDHDRAVFEQRVRHLAGYLAEHLTGANAIDAIVLVTDCEVFAAAAACRLFGKEPQRDVLLAGYDNYWREAFERQWEATEPIATVDKHNRQLGRSLANLLVARLDGELPDEPQRQVVAQRLVITGQPTPGDLS